MFKKAYNKAQAATELAVFGAILIFLIGSIVRTAAGNSYTQNQNFKAMRIAMLSSWNGSKATNTSRNTASVLFLEDRLSPDFNKYGDLDRNPFVANGSGSFSYQMLYPLDLGEVAANLPLMDIYINGQHFPLTLAGYVQNQAIVRPLACNEGNSCQQNRCLRNKREWVGGIAYLNQFLNVVPVSTSTVITDTNCLTMTPGAQQRSCQAQVNAANIFKELIDVGLVCSQYLADSSVCDPKESDSATSGFVTSLASQNTLPTAFSTVFDSQFASSSDTQGGELKAIQSILNGDKNQYKLFYTMIPNGTDQFTVTPPTCSTPNTPACKDKELSTTIQTENNLGQMGYWNGVDPKTQIDHSGDMMYDLGRNGDYSAATGVEVASPKGFDTPISNCPVDVVSNNMRCNIAWQWAATAGTNANQIGLNSANNQYPSYDMFGKLKEQTIYNISQNSTGATVVSYEDSELGDIDPTWDINSCGPKPGLQNDAQIFTFTKDGTYLKIIEGKLYNPETDQFVRSANQRDSIDLIQRSIQLSTNTGRFCKGTSNPTPQACIARCLLVTCNSGQTTNCCTPSVANNNCNCTPDSMTTDSCTPLTKAGASYPAESASFVPDANPVEVCVDGSSDNCFTSANIAKTCMDVGDNIIFVRSRLEDRRGGYWMTDASGKLKVGN